MLQAAEALVPIVLLVAIGAALRKGEFIDSQVRRGMDRFTYWVALPALFVHQLSETDFGELVAVELASVLVLAALAGCLVSVLVAALGRLNRDDFGVLVQAGFRGNLAFVGLPLIIFALGGADQSGELVSAALVVLAALVPVYNVISVLALLTAQQSWSLELFPRLGLELLKNPLIISAVLGALLGWLGWRLPVLVARPLDLLGQTALALALVSLGGALIELEVRGQIRLALVAGALKVAVIPVVTYGLCLLLKLPTEYMVVAMIFAACPTASASYILTTQLGGNDALAAACVVVSTVMSLGALTVVLVLFGA